MNEPEKPGAVGGGDHPALINDDHLANFGSATASRPCTPVVTRRRFNGSSRPVYVNELDEATSCIDVARPNRGKHVLDPYHGLLSRAAVEARSCMKRAEHQ